MNTERTLSFQSSQKLTLDEVESISAAGMTHFQSGHASYGQPGGWDYSVDVTVDF